MKPVEIIHHALLALAPLSVVAGLTIAHPALAYCGAVAMSWAQIRTAILAHRRR